MKTLVKAPLYISFIFLIACGGTAQETESTMYTSYGKKNEHPNEKETGSGKSKGKPSSEEPVVEEPVVEEPVVEEPAVEEPVVEEPVVEEPVVEEPVVEEPVVEEPVVEEPVVEEPVVEEPVVEEPVVEEPVVEEPVVEEPVEEFIVQELTLRWNPTYEDELGNTIHKNEIENYTLYWGNDLNNLDKAVKISDIASDSYVFTAQTAGDYYFAISVESIYGTHSQASNIVYKQVN
jgi:hypothetical protein